MYKSVPAFRQYFLDQLAHESGFLGFNPLEQSAMGNSKSFRGIASTSIPVFTFITKTLNMSTSILNSFFKKLLF